MPTITGTENDDILIDTAGDDTIDALGGNDTITVENGRDDVFGGAGSDTLIVDYGDAATAITTQGGGDQPVRPVPDGSGGYEGFIGDLINRFTQFDGIEKFVITTGSANDIIQLPNGENATDDIVDLGGGNDETALGRGVDIADGGTGVDGLDADLSQVAGDISIDLNANTYSGVAGGSFTNFEYFTDRDGGFRTGTGNDNVVTRNADLDDNVRLGAGNDSVTVYNGTDVVVGYGLDTAAGEGGFDSLVVDYGAATANITTDGGFLQADADGQGWDGRITDGGSRFLLFFGFDRFDITTGSGNDVFNYFNLANDADNVFHLGAGNDSVNLSQSTGDNYLDGGSGNDTLTGGFGNDTYVVDSASDVINDFFGGIDEVRTDRPFWALSTDLENLTGTGNVVQMLVGNAGANVIDGGLNGDTIRGLAGNDTLKVRGGTYGGDTGHDYVEGGADNDLLLLDYSALTAGIGLYVQSDGASGATGFADIPAGNRVLDFTEVERLQITTGTGNDTVNGFQNDDVIATGAGTDLIIAGAGNDRIDGGTGADDMRGGDGNDTYIVDDLGDQITEAAGGSSGVDEVRTGLESYTLGANVENLTGTSSEGQTLIGNAGLNVITGAAGNDILIGGRGDTLTGNAGDDYLQLSGFASGAGLSFAQGGSGGNDTLRVDFSDYSGAVSTGIGPDMAGGSSGAFMDPAGMFPMNVLVAFSGIENFEIVGSAGADTFTTGTGDDFIDGGAGADVMAGGLGNDAYVVDNAGDVVSEGGDAGTDEILTSVASFSLAGLDNIENLTGTSNEGQTLIGNDGVNLITGAGGNDGVDGGGGDDTFALSGNRADYQIVDNEDGTYTLTDSRGSGEAGDGSDTIGNIEFVRFADGTFAIAGLLDAAPVLGAPTNATITYTEDGPHAPLMQGVTLTDADSPANFAGGSLGLTVGGVGGGLNLRTGTDFRVNSNGDNTFSLAIQVGPTQIGIGTISGIGTLNVQITDLTAQATSERINNLIDDFIYLNLSNTPVEGDRTVTLTFTDAAANQVQQTQTLTVVAHDDPTVAVADSASTDEANPVSGNLLTNDTDVDSPKETIAAVNGTAANVGTELELLSGALLTVNADGSYSYDPNGAFDSTPAAGSGASNTPDTDSFTYTLTNGGTATVNLTIGGLDSNDTLVGAPGADVLAGGGGDDRYFIDEAIDVVNEAPGAGFDRVLASVSYALAGGSHVEMLTTNDNFASAAINLTGNALAQYIYGNAGANQIDGNGGGDVMYGFGGDDRFLIRDSADRVVELAGGGFDRILAAASFTLEAGSEVEMLTTDDNLSTSAINLTGNALAQYLYGNAGANALDGGGCGDVMYGFGGDDRFHIRDAADRVVESAAGGFDRVLASASFTLEAGSQVEMLTTDDNLSTSAINLTGNELFQYVYGNAGSNTLDGGGGGDVMYGLEGDDRFIIRDSADRVAESAGQGFDRVLAAASFTLEAGQDIEMFTTVDNLATTAIDLTGNEISQYLYGNAGANILDGKGGADLLTGFGGADSFAFTSALDGTVDRIADFESGSDRILLDDAVFAGLAPGALDANAFVTGSGAADADDRIVYDQATGRLFFDADGSGAGAMVHFATVDGAPIISASDFTMI